MYKSLFGVVCVCLCCIAPEDKQDAQLTARSEQSASPSSGATAIQASSNRQKSEQTQNDLIYVVVFALMVCGVLALLIIVITRYLTRTIKQHSYLEQKPLYEACRHDAAALEALARKESTK